MVQRQVKCSLDKYDTSILILFIIERLIVECMLPVPSDNIDMHIYKFFFPMFLYAIWAYHAGRNLIYKFSDGKKIYILKNGMLMFAMIYIGHMLISLFLDFYILCIVCQNLLGIVVLLVKTLIILNFGISIYKCRMNDDHYLCEANSTISSKIFAFIVPVLCGIDIFIRKNQFDIIKQFELFEIIVLGIYIFPVKIVRRHIEKC